ncbi:MAG: GTPase Era [bacterium]
MSTDSSKAGYISIVGAPNVGKSTLLNSLVGERLAIVTHKPQTTRNKILGIRTENEAQMIFLDTPGIHRTARAKLNQRMVRRALEAINEADLILFVADASRPLQPDEEYTISVLAQAKRPIILIVNKIDLVPKENLLPIIDQYNTRLKPAEIFPISALQGENMEELIPKIISYLPSSPHYYPDDALTDRSTRFIVAEMIREKVIRLTMQELPYSTAVEIEAFKENNPNGVIRISATIFVERDSQKGILIGRGGSMLKRIGQTAREDIEQYLGSKVFLELWVKVSKDWADNEKSLNELGY